MTRADRGDDGDQALYAQAGPSGPLEEEVKGINGLLKVLVAETAPELRAIDRPGPTWPQPFWSLPATAPIA